MEIPTLTHMEIGHVKRNLIQQTIDIHKLIMHRTLEKQVRTSADYAKIIESHCELVKAYKELNKINKEYPVE